MGKVRIGLIGLGFMGSTHFRIYEELEDAQIVALADVDPRKRAGDVSSVIGNIGNADNSVPLDMTGIKTYESGYDLINDPDVDVVDICVPTPDHAGLIIAGSLLYAFGMNVFLTPLHLFSGGGVGLAQLITLFLEKVITFKDFSRSEKWAHVGKVGAKAFTL